MHSSSERVCCTVTGHSPVTPLAAVAMTDAVPSPTTLTEHRPSFQPGETVRTDSSLEDQVTDLSAALYGETSAEAVVELPT